MRQRVGLALRTCLYFGVETQRVLSQKTRSIVFLRYNYEDVRLRNIESLLIKDILVPDEVVRLSRFGVSFVFDTRERCERPPAPVALRSHCPRRGAPSRLRLASRSPSTV